MPHYVIVGAGSAGCVLASRLSEDPAAEVVLIEAGPPDTAQEIHIPVTWPQLLKSRHDWDYASEREPGLDRRRVYLPRGKMLGGSSSMNAMVYIRARITTAGPGMARRGGLTTISSPTFAGRKPMSAARTSSTANSAR